MRDTSLLKGKQQRTTFAGSIFRKSCQSLLSLLAEIGKTTKTTSTTYNYASPGQHAMRDTSLLKGKQQNTTKRTVCTVYILAEFVLLEMNTKRN